MEFKSGPGFPKQGLANPGLVWIFNLVFIALQRDFLFTFSLVVSRHTEMKPNKTLALKHALLRQKLKPRLTFKPKLTLTPFWTTWPY